MRIDDSQSLPSRFSPLRHRHKPPKCMAELQNMDLNLFIRKKGAEEEVGKGFAEMETGNIQISYMWLSSDKNESSSSFSSRRSNDGIPHKYWLHFNTEKNIKIPIEKEKREKDFFSYWIQRRRLGFLSFLSHLNDMNGAEGSELKTILACVCGTCMWSLTAESQVNVPAMSEIANDKAEKKFGEKSGGRLVMVDNG